MILESPLPEIVIPNISYGDYVLSSLKRFGNQIALIDEENQQKIFTFNHIRELSIKYAIAFQEHGVKKGDIISTCFSNCLEYPSILTAASICGAVVATCNPNYTESEIKKQFSNVCPKMVITDAQSFLKLKKVSKDFPSIKMVITVEKSSFCESLSKWIGSISEDYPEHVQINPSNDVILLIHSSGTTGLPKAMMLTHRNVVSCGEMLKLSYAHSTADIDYVSQPMFHNFGTAHTMCNLVQGTRTIIGKRFRIENFLKLVEIFKLTHFTAVPAMVLSIYNCTQLSKYDLSSLKIIYSGSSFLPESVGLYIKKKLNVRLYQGYGLTEGLLSSCSIFPGIPVNSVGVPLPNTQIKIVDVQTGKSVEQNQLGEICGRNSLVMKGYYENPAATDQCIDSDGWLHSGDIGYFDEFGFLYIVDRMKELIKYKAFQVAPAELEQVLMQHPHIKDAAVVGVPDEAAGELPKAFIVRNNQNLTAEEIQGHMAEKLAKYKQLRGGIEFCDNIPRNHMGKILRRELRMKPVKSKL